MNISFSFCLLRSRRMDLPTWIVVLATIVFQQQFFLSSARLIGVCYGTVGDNLPPPQDVINLYKKYQIEMLRLYEPSPPILEALRGSKILVSLGIKNQDLANLASNQDDANAWVQTNVVPYKNDVAFTWITAGNEVIPGPLAQYVPGAMTNIFNALIAVGLDRVKVTTVIAATALGASFPPSTGAFSSEVINVMTEVSTFSYHYGMPLMINVYPYFAYVSDPIHITSDYALFNSQTPVVVDQNLKYYNLFDAMVDAFNAALEKINMSDVYLGISETGWPSAGNSPYTTIENAKIYNTNLINHVLKGGTPRRPDHHYDTFVFAMFNEDLKQPPGVEQNFGLFYPNMEPVYQFFNSS